QVPGSSSPSTCCQPARRSRTQCGNTRRMNQKRSNISVQNSTQRPASAHITAPPLAMKSNSAWALSTTCSHLACNSFTTRRPGQVQRDQTGTLLFQYLDQPL